MRNIVKFWKICFKSINQIIQQNQCIGCVTLKKFVKGKWFPLTLAAVIAAIIAFILFLFGFRITYSPELDNNWDAVSAVAAWVGVIASFVAIRFAIRVPKQIAKSQNDIALFEKRYQLYKSLSPLVNFGNDLLRAKDEKLKEFDEKTRARHYLMLYIMAEGRNYDEIIDIGLNVKFIYNNDKKLLGCKVSHHEIKDMNVYKLKLKQHIYANKSDIDLTSFLFNQDIEELLRKLADSYCNFMNLVCHYSELDNNDIVESCEDEVIDDLDYQTCPMEIRKREFLNLIKEISNKNILGKIEECLRII